MKLLLNTSSFVTELVLLDNQGRESKYIWESGRNLSRDLLHFMHKNLAKHNFDFSDLTGLGFLKGPGSFTGLRIGATVMNTLADSLNIPIVGVNGDDWVNKAIDRLGDGEDDRVVLPFYGAGANITKPRK